MILAEKKLATTRYFKSEPNLKDIEVGMEVHAQADEKEGQPIFAVLKIEKI